MDYLPSKCNPLLYVLRPFCTFFDMSSRKRQTLNKAVLTILCALKPGVPRSPAPPWCPQWLPCSGWESTRWHLSGARHQVIKYWKMRNTGNISWTSDTKVLFETHHSLKRMCLHTLWAAFAYVLCLCSEIYVGQPDPGITGAKRSRSALCSAAGSGRCGERGVCGAPAGGHLTSLSLVAWHTAGCSLGLEWWGSIVGWCQVLSRNPPLPANHGESNF